MSLVKFFSAFSAVCLLILVSQSNAVLADQKSEIACVQTFLDFWKLKPGPIDGALGAKTVRASRAFQEKRGGGLPTLSSESTHEWCQHALVSRQFARLLAGDKQPVKSFSYAKPRLSDIFIGGHGSRYEQAERNIKNPRALELVPLADGSAAARVAVNYEDKGHPDDWLELKQPGMTQRYELTEKRKLFQRPGKTYWHRISIFIPAGTHIKDHVTLFGMHPWGKTIGLDPVFYLMIAHDWLRFQHTLDESFKCVVGPSWRGGDVSYCDADITIERLKPVYKITGKWITLVSRVYWGSKQGTYHLWMNNELVLGVKGPTHPPRTISIGNKFGVLRGYYETLGTPSPDLSIYFSKIGRAKDCKSLELLNCAQFEADIKTFGKFTVHSTKKLITREMSKYLKKGGRVRYRMY
ncbi:Polysaccharide lyase [Pseudovibrio denitrificans]|uniref:Polysaccharide lyase n=1 Tax=Pseudovibrio denitrificans TaxID=258256 RepID=A0A1I6XK40_9HYPH|nr:heparin lyase I family protein [Pseudovibrio denitrificans]SFT38401.1 Polysaccharide lyase [Pseudovibrio denitrificans]